MEKTKLWLEHREEVLNLCVLWRSQGIATKEMQKRLFGLGYRTNRGTGLGQSLICRHLVSLGATKYAKKTAPVRLKEVEALQVASEIVEVTNSNLSEKTKNKILIWLLEKQASNRNDQNVSD